MTEKILLAPGANGTELIRMLARFGKNTLGLRIMNGAELAKYALTRSGIVLEENFLPRKQEPAVVDGFVREISYFSSAAYADSEKIAEALYSIRSLIPEDESGQLRRRLPAGEFPEKNQSLLAVYQRYLGALRSAGNIDTVGLIRRAMDAAAALPCPVYTLKEYPLTPLEDALVQKLGHRRIHTSLTGLLELDGAVPRDIDYTESYGSSNEVETIFDYIVSNGIPFDECTVAVANTSQYAQLFYDFAQSHGLSITLGCGIPILNSNPARLLKLLQDWSTTGYRGVDGLRALLHSDALDQKKLLALLGIEKPWQLERLIDLAGQLRLGFDREENRKKIAALPGSDRNQELASSLSALSEQLSLGESKLIEKFTLIRDGAIGRVDRSALSVICDTLDAYAKYAADGNLSQIIPEILQKSVCSENSREGALFVTGISGALASMRPHLFLAGMSASNFPGTPRENYLLLDSDYLLLADEVRAPTSVNSIQRKKDGVEHLLALAAALGVRTHISYSGYDLANLKEENPSSVLFDIFKKQHGQGATLGRFKEAFRHVVYFGQRVSGDYPVGQAYVGGREIAFQAPDRSEERWPYTGDKAFSPTAIDDFFNCPRHFMLTNLLGIREQERDDPFTVIDPSATGTLAHSLMEGLARNPWDRSAFLQKADEAFDRFLLERPPIHRDSAAAEKLAFRKMMANAYDMDPKNQVLASEEDQRLRHSCGILLRGIPDRVEKNDAGEYIIADYKTGRRVRHQPHDIDTCLQVVLYAYLLEQRGVPICRCEYRYLRDSLVIPCRYDDAMKEALERKLLIFKQALDTGNFPPAADQSACTYCTLSGICGKDAERKEEAECEQNI